MASKYSYNKKYIYKKKEKLEKLKDKPCKRCEKKYPSYVMEWHHRNPKTKKFTISSGSFRYGIKTILKEIKKCDLYCANCHRIIEYESKK